MKQSVDTFVELLPQEQQDIVNRLREILKSAGLQESTKYTIPFYSTNKNVAYINPGRDRVILGICCGAALYMHHDVLVGKQTAVRHYVVRSMDDIDEERILQILKDAIEFYA